MAPSPDTEIQNEETQGAPRRSTLRTVLYTLLLCGGLLLITFVILESTVRLLTHPYQPILYSDERVGTIHKPLVREYLWNEESGDEELTFTNSLGYIGLREPGDPKGDAVRIAFVGDSVTEGLQVDYYESFPVLIENAFNVTQGTSSTERVQAFNYGVGGTGTFLQLLRYREHIRPYDMDIVALVLYDNDFEDNFNKINYDVDSYSEAPDRNTTLRKILLTFELPRFIFKQLMSEVWFLKTLNFFGLYELNEHTITKLEHGRGALEVDPRYYTFTLTLIKKMHDEVQADGGTFIVILRGVSPDNSSTEVQKMYRTVREYLDTEDIAYVDTGVDFWMPYGSENVCLTFKCSGHLNALGHRVLAQTLFPALDNLISDIEHERTLLK